jgi:antitoxin HicB
MRYVYPFTSTPDEDGRFVVAFPNVRGASTDGVDEAEAIENAPDCLTAALKAYVTLGEPLPRPSPVRGRATVALPPLTTAKLVLYSAMHDRSMTAKTLAHQLGVAPAVVERLLDLDHRSHIGEVETALARLGKRLEIGVREVALTDEMLDP